ncbi:MAG TPA: DNA repair protein RadC [Fimbriimonadaceae bacterium]|nr:DNA repair protein RadC [Fimbriimonadaceae bacterium]
MPGSKIVEKLQTYGLGTASPVDLAAIGFSRREEDVDAGEPRAKEFIKAGHRLLSLTDAAAEDVKRHFGLEGYEALRAMALLELGRRTAQVGKGPVTSIGCAEDVFRLLRDELRNKRQEYFYAVLLDSKNNVLKKCQVHAGTLTASLVGPREVFREAIREGASALIVAHNHPSGDPTPSPEDVEVTRKLRSVGEMLDIPLLDHVVVGDERWTSLADSGLM